MNTPFEIQNHGLNCTVLQWGNANLQLLYQVTTLAESAAWLMVTDLCLCLANLQNGCEAMSDSPHGADEQAQAQIATGLAGRAGQPVTSELHA